MDGFETGDTNTWSSGIFGTWTVQTSVVRTGAYAVKATASAAQPANALDSQAFAGTTEGWFRFYMQLTGLSANIALEQLVLASLPPFHLDVITNGSSAASLALYNTQTNAQIGSSYAISQGQWLRIEMHDKISSTVGTGELLVNGITAASSVGNLNTGTSPFNIAYLQFQGTVSLSGTVYFDDALVNNNTSTAPGPGGLVARQCNTATPTFNTWSLSTGTNIYQVWDDLPVDSHWAFSSTNASKQTCGLSFGNTTDTGATGHGIGRILPNSIINGAGIVWLGLSTVANDTAQDSSIWFPNGGTETDTAGPAAYPSNQTSIWELTPIATPTAAQVLNVQAGIKHAANANTHNIYIMIVMVDYQPGPTSATFMIPLT